MQVRSGNGQSDSSIADKNFGVTRRKLIRTGGTAVAASALFSSFPAPLVRAAKPV